MCNKIHGESKTRLYKTWSSMKERCQNGSSRSYKNYGARGISVCDQWQDYITFRCWALDSGYSDKLSIERQNVNKGYSPENCTWIDIAKQARNTTKTKLKKEDVLSIRERYKNGETQASIRKDYNISKWYICKLIQNEYWRDLNKED